MSQSLRGEADRQAGAAIAGSLQLWLHDDGLGPVREAEELAKLPAEERAAFVKF